MFKIIILILYFRINKICFKLMKLNKKKFKKMVYNLISEY